MKLKGWQCHRCLTSSGQVTGTAKCCPQSQTDVIFVVIDTFVVLISGNDPIVRKHVTAM